MPQPRNIDISRHTNTGGHFRQRLKNFIGGYVDTSKTMSKMDPSTTARLVSRSICGGREVE